MGTRAKFRVDSVEIKEESVYNRETKESEHKQVASIILRPVTGASKENEEFYAHLNVCSQCENHPFALCPTGARLLKYTATGEMEVSDERSRIPTNTTTDFDSSGNRG